MIASHWQVVRRAFCWPFPPAPGHLLHPPHWRLCGRQWQGRVKLPLPPQNRSSTRSSGFCPAIPTHALPFCFHDLNKIARTKVKHQPVGHTSISPATVSVSLRGETRSSLQECEKRSGFRDLPNLYCGTKHKIIAAVPVPVQQRPR